MTSLLQVSTLQRLGATVLHALWELAAIALVIWLVLLLMRRCSSRANYVVACLGMVAMILVPVLTWFWISAMSAAGSQGVQVAGGLVVEVTPIGRASALSVLLAGLSLRTPWIALLWCAGFTLMLFRLGVGLWWLERAYLAAAKPVSGSLQEGLDRLASRMGITQTVRLLASAKAESPLLLGWWRPVILVPAAAFLQVNPMALEAVLAHELAHVRRFDYLMNLLQNLAEACLFFHPCAWWLSGRIREFREHCCDDVAARLCGDPLILAEGLSALERLRRRMQPDPEPALAAAKGNLMSRITRLFQPQEVALPSLRGIAWTMAGLSLLGVAALTAQQAAPAQKGGTSVSSGPSPSASEEIRNTDFARIRVAFQPPAPPYPAEAKAAGVHGNVVLIFIIGRDGTPESVEAVEGPESLRPTAVEYGRKWRFEPAKVDGKVVKARFKLTMPFRLKGETTPTLGSDGVLSTDFSMVKVARQPPAPPYPPEAKEQRIQGTVVVELTVDEAGMPTEVKALEGPEMLQETAVAYARTWRFKPTKVHGKSVKVRFKLTMPFRLR